jgi:hypothetical protein
MKKIVQALVICSFLVVSSSMSFAVTTCGQMQIQLVEAAGMWLKNVTGSACGYREVVYRKTTKALSQ